MRDNVMFLNASSKASFNGILPLLDINGISGQVSVLTSLIVFIGRLQKCKAIRLLQHCGREDRVGGVL
jgi:hypothetical protein